MTKHRKAKKQQNHGSNQESTAQSSLQALGSGLVKQAREWWAYGLVILAGIMLIPLTKMSVEPAGALGGSHLILASSSTTNSPDSAPLMAGDQVKIQFFSQITLQAGKNSSASVKSNSRISVYERSDLSGNFTIAGNGTLSHPKFGLIKAKGKHLHQLEYALKQHYLKTTGKKIKVRATFVMRPPVYVAGLVKHPGAYKYMQGMTVMQVVTLASGLYRPGAGLQSSEMIDQQRAVVAKSEQLLVFALVRQARLRALQNNSNNISTSQKLIRMVGKTRARKLIHSENKLFQRTRKSKALYRKRLMEAKQLANAEIKTIKSQKRNFLNQQKIVERKLLRYRKIYKRSRVRASMQADKEMAQFELQHLNLQNEQTKLASSMIQAKYKINKIEQELAAQDVAELVKLETDMDGLEIQLIGYRADLTTARTALGTFASKVKRRAKVSKKKPHLAYELTRRTDGNFNSFAASANTFVKPGDVIKVKYRTDEIALKQTVR